MPPRWAAGSSAQARLASCPPVPSCTHLPRELRVSGPVSGFKASPGWSLAAPPQPPAVAQEAAVQREGDVTLPELAPRLLGAQLFQLKGGVMLSCASGRKGLTQARLLKGLRLPASASASRLRENSPLWCFVAAIPGPGFPAERSLLLWAGCPAQSAAESALLQGSWPPARTRHPPRQFADRTYEGPLAD